MGDKVIEVKLKRLDKKGVPIEEGNVSNAGFDFIISVYFDYDNDNYHIQFPQGADRMTVAKALYKLSENVRQGNK